MKTKIYLSLYLVYLFIASWIAISQPFYGWDMIPYSAIVLSHTEEMDSKSLHTKTYDIIRKSIPSQVYINQTSSAYQKEMEQNEAYFNQQLPFYKIRPLYTGLAYLVHQTGINILTAIILISVLSSFLMSILILRWLLDYLDEFYAYLFAFLIIHSTGIIQIARIFTPDALSALVLIFSIYILTQKRLYFASFFLVLAIFARTDNIILVLIVLTYLRFFSINDYRLNWKSYIFFMLFATFSYLSINYLANNYGWSTIFHHTLISLINNPADYHPIVTLSDYLRVLRQNSFEAFLWVNSTFIFLLFAFVSIFLDKLNDGIYKIYSHLTILLILSVIIHLVLFPAFWIRFFIAHYAIISLSMLIIIGFKKGSA